MQIGIFFENRYIFSNIPKKKPMPPPPIIATHMHSCDVLCLPPLPPPPYTTAHNWSFAVALGKAVQIWLNCRCLEKNNRMSLWQGYFWYICYRSVISLFHPTRMYISELLLVKWFYFDTIANLLSLAVCWGKMTPVSSSKFLSVFEQHMYI